MSKIEWTEQTWNPIVGCSIVSPGCTNCYAMKMAARLDAMGVPHYAGLTQASKAGAVWTGKLALAPEKIVFEPLRRRKPTMYFVNSMGDLFHEDVPDEWIDRVFAVMALCPQHTLQVLTKRSARMLAYMASPRYERIYNAMGDLGREGLVEPHPYRKAFPVGMPWPLPNVWLGVSAERQKEADERIPDLLATPAAVRFVSAEPLLGPIDFTRIKCPHACSPPDYCNQCHPDGGTATGTFDALQRGLDWIIAGGESGPGARPMHPDWARSIRDQCAAAGVPFFFKQWGEYVTGYLDGEDFNVDEDTYGPNVQWRGIAVCSHGTKEDDLGEGSWGKVGKKAAGRVLDGREHNGMPGAKAPEVAE